MIRTRVDMILHRLGRIARAMVPMVVGLAVLMQALNRDLIAAAFYFNQRYIAENFCENISRPDLHCNGTCQLTKALHKAAEQEKHVPVPNIKVDAQICEQWSAVRVPPRFGARVARLFPTDLLFLPSHLPADIFRPPIVG